MYMANGAQTRCSVAMMRRLAVQAAVVIMSCSSGNGFVPAAHRLSSNSVVHSRSSSISPCRSSLSMTATNDHNKQPTASNSWGVPGTVAACLATATILSSSIAAEASIAGVYADGSPLGDLERHGAPTMMVLSEGESVEGRADVTGLVAEMKSADSAGRLLNTMVKINDVVDADEEGVLENPFAKESIVKGLIDKRRAGGDVWDGDTETAFGILKRKLDPFNVVLLRPYLKIAPFLGGAYYLAVFFVQQKFREFFPFAYFGAVAVFVAPALIILLFN